MIVCTNQCDIQTVIFGKAFLTQKISGMLKDSIFFRHNGALKKLNIDDIVILEAANNYVKFLTEEGIFMVRITMDAAVKSLPPTKFVRVHRLYAVSIKDIDTIGKDLLKLKDVKSEIPVSRQYYSKFLSRIKILDASAMKQKSSDWKNQSSQKNKT
jgi:DNA-binding LytR/AlgR family response regulator